MNQVNYNYVRTIKIRHVAGEVALYTNLEVEIAHFNNRGI
jgi:hypothetical protein